MAARLKGTIHFMRVSVDGIGRTYEEFRGRPFADLLRALELVASISPFGLNVVVNAETVHQLDELLELATSFGASEILLLPEQATDGRSGAGEEVVDALLSWIKATRSLLRLSVSAMAADERFPVGRPFRLPGRDYAHVSADGVLKHSSFALAGVPISGPVMHAVEELFA